MRLEMGLEMGLGLGSRIKVNCSAERKMVVCSKACNEPMARLQGRWISHSTISVDVFNVLYEYPSEADDAFLALFLIACGFPSC